MRGPEDDLGRRDFRIRAQLAQTRNRPCRHQNVAEHKIGTVAANPFQSKVAIDRSKYLGAPAREQSHDQVRDGLAIVDYNILPSTD